MSRRRHLRLDTSGGGGVPWGRRVRRKDDAPRAPRGRVHRGHARRARSHRRAAGARVDVRARPIGRRWRRQHRCRRAPARVRRARRGHRNPRAHLPRARGGDHVGGAPRGSRIPRGRRERGRGRRDGEMVAPPTVARRLLPRRRPRQTPYVPSADRHTRAVPGAGPRLRRRNARVDPGVHTRRRRAAREGRLEMPSPSTHLNNQPNRSDGPDVHRPQPTPHTEQHGTLHERYGRPASNPRS